MTEKLIITKLSILAFLLLTKPTIAGTCTAGKCVRCKLVAGTTSTYSCLECINSLLTTTASTNIEDDGSCTGDSTGITNCVKTSFINSVVRCTECGSGFGLQTDTNGATSCVANGITNCYSATRSGTTGAFTCQWCDNGFTLNTVTNTCTASTSIGNCVATRLDGTNNVCARCAPGYVVSSTGTCISTPDGRCLDNTDTFTENGHCNNCNFYNGFYAVRATTSGTQLCSNGDGSEFNTATTTTANPRLDINNVIRQTIPGFSKELVLALGAVIGYIGVSLV